jgi:hypothetical protein
MGAAEFEFGAMPKAYRAIAANLSFFKLYELEDFLEDPDKPEKHLCVFTCFEGEDWNKYLEQLKKMREHKLRLKEGSRFEKGAFVSSYDLQIDLWWDIKNQVIWSFDRKFMKNISVYLTNSAKYIETLD